MNLSEKRAHVAHLLAEYGDQVRPDTANLVRNALNAGEWGLALAEIAHGFANSRVPITSEDARITRHLLSIIPLPPDMPKDIADDFLVIDE